MKCKIFKNSDTVKLEQNITTFISKDNIIFIKIKYSSHAISDDSGTTKAEKNVFTALILYNEK